MEEIVKFAAILTSVFAIYKIVVEVVLSRSSRRRDEYNFTKNFISDVESGSEHRFTLEKGFFALTGKQYSVEEIKILLHQNNPSNLINLKASSGAFIIYNEKSKAYEWKGSYSKPHIQRYAGSWFLILYMVTASLSLLPIYLKGMELLSKLPVATFTVSLMIIAISFLIKQSDFSSAKSFMEKIEYENA